MLILRILNIIGCIFILWCLFLAAYRSWSGWNEKTRMHWWALTGWVFFGLEQTIENLIQDNSSGPKTIIQALVVAWTIHALLVNEPINVKTSVPWKKDQTDERE